MVGRRPTPSSSLRALNPFSGRHMDVGFRTRGGARVRVVERPGLWMPTEDLEALLLDLRTVVRAGLEVRTRPIRGGTDGSRLSFMGLPTPNLFAGEHNFHSRLEWVSVQDMEKAVEVIVELAQVWEEQSR